MRTTPIRVLGILTAMLIGIPAVGMLIVDLTVDHVQPGYSSKVQQIALHVALIVIATIGVIGAFRSQWKLCLVAGLGLFAWIAVTMIPDHVIELISLSTSFWLIAPFGYLFAAHYLRHRMH